MKEADIAPGSVYLTIPIGRYHSVERLVVKIEPRPLGMLVFYRVRRDGIFSDVLYTMVLDRFAKGVATRLA